MAPSLVQSKSATAASTSPVGITLTSPTTAGNCLIVCVVTSSSPSNPTVTGITLGGAAGNFASVVTAGNPASDSETLAIWADPNCAGGQTAVSVTLSAASGSCNVWVMEWSGLATSTPVDKTAGQAQSAVTSWSSTATATTTQASEVAIGAVGTFNGSGVGTITGPSSPWTNLAQVTSASTHVGLLAGYNILSSTGTVTYSGTFASSSDGATVVATFKASSLPNTNASAGLASGSGTGLGATGNVSPAAGLAAGSGTALGAQAVGPPFPQTPLKLQLDLNLGGTWTGIASSLAYQRDGSQAPVTITRGRPDESSQANPATCAWSWNNRDGRFSPRNPVSPYYGQLGRNTPARWSVPAASSYLRLENNNGDRASAADNARLDITGSLEARWYGRMTDWQGGMLGAKMDGGECWEWRTENVGTMRFGWVDNSAVFRAASSTVPVPFTTGDFALRVLFDATTGTVAFYTSTSIDGTWTLLGSALAATGGAATSITTASSPLTVGFSTDTPFQTCGRVYEFRLYNGIGGTVVADAVFSSLSAGTTSWTDAQGNAWSLVGGAEISSRDYRFHGEMSALPPRWDVTGNDQWVAAAAGGPLRRLQQGTANAMSAMKRAILLQSGSLAPVAYWPLEDAAGATQFGAAIGTSPMIWGGGPPVLASNSAFACSAPLPVMGSNGSGANLQGTVPAYTAGGGAAWTVRWLMDIGTLPGSAPVIMQVDCVGGLAAYVVLTGAATSGGAIQLVAYDAALNVLADTGLTAVTGGIQGPFWWSIEAQESGSHVQYSVVLLAPGNAVGQSASVTSSATGIPGNVAQVLPVTGGGWPDTALGHVQVQYTWVSLGSLFGALEAWTGELAAVRYARLAAENGYLARILGAPSFSAAMGAQGQATLSALLQECEAADMGQQFEPRQQLALGYRTLASMCSQSPALSLSYTSSQPGGVNGSATDGGLDPTYDDQLTANDWTVTRGAASGSQGGTWQSTLNDGSTMSISDPPVGVGDYAKTVTVNVAADGQLPDVAGWMVHRGTVDDERWPSVPVNLARPAMSSLQAAAMQLEVGDMVQVTSLPQVVLYDPVKQLAYGFREALGGFHWTMEFNAVPEQPYEVIILDDPVLGRLDTDGSTLASGVSAGAVTLSVATAGTFPIWTTAAADFPFDLAVGGERITVTNITGSSSPQSFTVTRAVNGVSKAQSSGADVRLWTPPVLALT